jgi:hypothetical protein
LCSVTFTNNRAVYEKMWKNIVERAKPQMAIWRTCIACWIPKAANTHTFPICNTYSCSTTTRLHKHTTALRYTVTLQTFHKQHSSFCTTITEMYKVHSFNFVSNRSNTMYKRLTKRYALTVSMTVLQQMGLYMGATLRRRGVAGFQ